MTVQHDLDDIDKAIINELQVDGRSFYSRLAPLAGLSEAAVRQRVNRLQGGGVIQIVAVTDPVSLGYPIQAMLGCKVLRSIDATAEKISQIGAVTYSIITTGRFDILVEVVCRDADELISVSNQIRESGEGCDVEVMTYLRMVQQKYDWGTM